MGEDSFVIDKLDGYQFEELIARIMKKNGYENIRITPKSRDLGKDIIMDGPSGAIIVVECKHQKFVGRPVVQKLQGALSHEKQHNPTRSVQGMVVTSGAFSQEAIEYTQTISEKIRLIDGRALRELCKNLDILILNGKVQIIHNKSFRNISEDEAKDCSLKCFSQTYGAEKYIPSIDSKLNFRPSLYVTYSVNFTTSTSIGCIDKYSASGDLATHGITGKTLNDEVKKFFFSNNLDSENIKPSDADKKSPYEFTQNDLEEHALNYIIKQHTHKVKYSGKNSVTYYKTCTPKNQDIYLQLFLPVYLPLWTNSLKVMQFEYTQKFYAKGDKRLFIQDELKDCKICNKNRPNYNEMNVCSECARIVCKKHIKIDYLDKKTPICTIHAKPLRLFIQKKYFASENTLSEYRQSWKAMKVYKKVYEDKIVLFSLISFFVLLIFTFAPR
jgi:restriction system protein